MYRLAVDRFRLGRLEKIGNFPEKFAIILSVDLRGTRRIQRLFEIHRNTVLDVP